MYERSNIFNVEDLRRTRSKMLGRPLCARVLSCLVVIAFAVLPAVAQPQDDMVLIPSGEFLMGDHHDSMSHSLPVHAVGLDSFNMDIHEVTNQSYACALNWAWEQQLITVSGGVVYKVGGSEPYCNTTASSSNSRIIWDGNRFSVTGSKEDHPMIMVSWYGSAAYANWRSAMEGRTPCYDTSTWDCDPAADGYRLPTEAEWEYAARGGECTGGEHDPYCRYPWGDTIEGSMANYRNSGDPFEGTAPKTTPVGYYDGDQTPPGSDMANGYGLYDMAGNVYEYCNDRFGAYSHCDPPPCNNPTGPQSGTSRRVARGGSWGNLVGALRIGGERTWEAPHWRWPYHGFRMVLPVTEPPSPYYLKTETIDQLEGLLTMDVGDQDLIDAIGFLNMSLGLDDPRAGMSGSDVVWGDPEHVDECHDGYKGVDVFQYEQAACDKLDAYMENDDNAQFDFDGEIEAVRQRWAEADQILAAIAIDDALAHDGDSDDIADAQSLKAEGDAAMADGGSELCDVALDKFEESWEKAVKSWCE